MDDTPNITTTFAFVLPDWLKNAPTPLENSLHKWSFDAHDFLVGLGVESNQAAGVVSGIMVRQAWLLAAMCKINSGHKIAPDPARFLDLARQQTEAFDFTDLIAEKANTPPGDANA